MAINNIATSVRNTMCDAFVDAIDQGTAAGILEIYTASFATLLATLTFADPAFGAAAAGVATLSSAPTADSSCDATGTAAVFRVKDQTAGNVLFEGTVSTSGADINFDSVSFSQGTTISIAAGGTITMPAS